MGEALHLSVDVEEGEDEAEGEQGGADQEGDDGVPNAFTPDAVGVFDDGEDLGCFDDSCSGVAGSGVLEGALHVVVGAVDVSVFVEEEGELAEGDVFADGKAEVGLCGAGEEALLLLSVVEAAVGVGQGVG